MTKVKSELQIGQLLGSGKHGDVYGGICPVHNKVAIKVISQRVGESDDDWKVRKTEMLEEGQSLARAKHSNVVLVHYLVESENSDALHLVMELCAHGSMQKAYESGPLVLGEVSRVLNDVCLGLEALHARKMLHRDIKPGNILRSQNKTAKLGDFGLVTDKIILGYAKAAGYGDHVAYEVWNKTGTSVRSDIWALGMTIYRLLHGHEWYSRYPRPQLIVGKGGFAKALQWLPHIPADWRRVIRKMLSDDTGTRYQSASQVMNAFAKLSNDPNFSCSVDNDEIVWIRVKGARKINVVWRRDANAKYEWEAWSEPIKVGTGLRRSLGKSQGKESFSKSHKELDRFFSGQK